MMVMFESFKSNMNNKSINPIYLGKQSADKVVEFMNQLEQIVTILCSLLRHASESNTKIARLSATKRCLIVKMFLSLCVFIGALELWWRLGFKFSAEVNFAEFVVTFGSVAVFVQAAAELTKIYQQSLGKKLDQRSDYKAEKGFTGEIEEDMEYLLGFLRARNARLVIVIDDLDRCKESDIVEILQAVILLLNDCPIMCFLPLIAVL